MENRTRKRKVCDFIHTMRIPRWSAVGKPSLHMKTASQRVNQSHSSWIVMNFCAKWTNCIFSKYATFQAKNRTYSTWGAFSKFSSKSKSCRQNFAAFLARRHENNLYAWRRIHKSVNRKRSSWIMMKCWTTCTYYLVAKHATFQPNSWTGPLRTGVRNSSQINKRLTQFPRKLTLPQLEKHWYLYESLCNALNLCSRTWRKCGEILHRYVNAIT